MPDSVEIPAPVRTTMRLDSLIQIRMEASIFPVAIFGDAFKSSI